MRSIRSLLVATVALILAPVSISPLRAFSIHVQVTGASVHYPNQGVSIGYTASMNDFWGTIYYSTLWSPTTSFGVWDDWDGYEYWTAWDYTYDDAASSVGFATIEYYAEAGGVDSENWTVTGWGQHSVAPETPRADRLQLNPLSDQTSFLPPSFCPSCENYQGRYRTLFLYNVYDQWGQAFLDQFSIDESFEFNDGSYCGDNFTQGGAVLQGGVAADPHRVCMQDCNNFPGCWGYFTQTIYLNAFALGVNEIVYFCNGLDLFYSSFW